MDFKSGLNVYLGYVNKSTLRVISGFCRSVNEIFVLLEFYCSIEWQYVTDVSRQPIGPIFKGQAFAVQDCLALQNGTNRLSRNVGNKRPLYAA
jgi:hypothetical protein